MQKILTNTKQVYVTVLKSPSNCSLECTKAAADPESEILQVSSMQPGYQTIVHNK